MKKSLIIMVLFALLSVDTYAKGKSKSSFGKWNYDKFGYASKKITSTEASKISDSADACRQYVHVKAKFHVRVKNWFRGVQLGLNGYAEMRATLGTSSKSCGIPYNIARMDIYYDNRRHISAINKSYIRAKMKGVGAVNECYTAVGYAYTDSGIVLPNGYKDNLSVSSGGTKIRGNIDIKELFDVDLTVYNIPFVRNTIPIAWFVPIKFSSGEYTIKTNSYAGAILNNKKGCYDFSAKTTIKF